MSISNYIEIGIMICIILIGAILLIVLKKKVSYIECDCKICKSKEIKGKKG